MSISNLEVMATCHFCGKEFVSSNWIKIRKNEGCDFSTTDVWCHDCNEKFNRLGYRAFMEGLI